MARGTTLRNIRIDDGRWRLLGQAAQLEDTDRSQLIRDMIDVYLEGYDWPEE